MKRGDFLKLSIKEYMLTKNVSRRTIYNRIEKGQLTTIKDGNKIYITAENMDVNYQVNASASEIKKITENTNKISKLHNKLEEFDYNFLRERLSSIEKSSITQLNGLNIFSNNFTATTNSTFKNLYESLEKLINNSSEKEAQHSASITELLKSIEKKLECLEEIQYLKEKVETLETSQNNISNKIDTLLNKFDEFTEKQERKKIGIFKK